MDGLDKNKIILISVAVIVIVLLAVFGFTTKFSLEENGTAKSSTDESNPVPGTDASNISVTKGAVPANVIVPSENSKDVPAGVAVPKEVMSGSPTGDVSYRSFAIKTESGKFMPDTVIVKRGDTIDLNITAVDKDYDFAQPDFGFRTPLPKGATKKIQFAATASGKFTFFCSACGGPVKGPVGYIVIAAKL